MDSRDGYFYTDVTRQLSTRRYTYEGYGGQKLDKTLILHKSEASDNDTIVLRLCKRTCGRMTWSSCVKGKLLLAILVAFMAIFCYFNLFSSYLPRPCRIFALRSSPHALKSVEDDTIHIRTRNALSEGVYEIDSSKNAKLVSHFTKKVAISMKDKTVLSSTLLQITESYQQKPSTVIKSFSVTASPDVKSASDPRKSAHEKGKLIVEIHHEEISEFELPAHQTGDMKLITRIMKSGKSVDLV